MDTQMETSRIAEKGFTEIAEGATALRKKIEGEEKDITAIIRRMTDLTSKMSDASDKQSNISMVVKKGIKEMIELIQQLNGKREVQKKEIDSLIGFLWTRTKSPKEDVSTSVATPKNKRVASSPAENQAATPIDKKKKDDSTPDNWNLALGRRAKRTKNRHIGEETPQRGERQTKKG